MKYSKFSLWIPVLLLIPLSLAASVTPQGSDNSGSDAIPAFHRFTLNFNPVYAVMGTLPINVEGFLTTKTSCFIEGRYTFPLFMEASYEGAGGVRFYSDTTWFWGFVMKTGKYRLRIEPGGNNPNEYHLRLRYLSAGVYYGKTYRIYKFDLIYRFGLCYPFKKEFYWKNDEQPPAERLWKATAALYAYLDSQLTIRIPLPF